MCIFIRNFYRQQLHRMPKFIFIGLWCNCKTSHTDATNSKTSLTDK